MSVPKLRFKEFIDEWKKVELDKLYEFKNGLNGDRSLYGKGVELINVSDILNNTCITSKVINGKININEDTLRKNSVEYGDILFQRSSETFLEIGTSNVYLDNKLVTFSGFVIRGKRKKDNINNPLFINYELKSPALRKKIIICGSGAQHFNIGQEDLKRITIFLPSIKEQKKIADMLELLDKKIELQTKRIEVLKLFKKGLLNEFLKHNPCSKISLKYILKERKNYTIKDGILPHVTLSKNGIEEKTERYNRDFLVKSKDKNYKITKIYDLCYNPANLKFGVICLNTYGSAIFSPIYVTFEINHKFNPLYIGYYVTQQNFINSARKYEQGTVYERMAVAPEDFLKMNIWVPNKHIQDKFSTILISMDTKLKKENEKLKKLEALKKGFMQNMFV